MSTTLTFGIFAVVFLATGIVLFVMSDSIFELSVRYDNLEQCRNVLNKWNTGTNLRETCTVPLNGGKPLEKEVQGPIYVYYQLDNFYQNHRRYVKSRDNEQLFGKYKNKDELTNCDPVI